MGEASMNGWEWLVYVWASTTLATYLRWQFQSWRTALPLLAICLVPLYLSLERTSQFYTMDDSWISSCLAGEARSFAAGSMVQACAMRTSLAVHCPVLAM